MGWLRWAIVGSKHLHTNMNESSPIDDIESDAEFLRIYEMCKPFSMTSIERAHALFESCKYIIKNDIKGDFVECGVWKGGSAMIMAHTLMSLDALDRRIYMYDTFSGMSEPEDIDTDMKSQSAKSLLETNDKKTSHVWSFATEDEVRQNIVSTGYDKSKLIFVRGKVEETIPKTMPGKIALLRLDTDWYASTYHELIHLYPRLAKSGILIIDDYGHWVGAKKAVDEYFKKNKQLVFLSRIDYTGRLLIKQQ